MTWITKIALKKRWVTILISALVAGASVWAMLTLKMELIPDIELPMTTVITIHPQAQPDDVVEQVTIPIEGTAEGISGFKHVSSTSSEGSSVGHCRIRAANRSFDHPPRVLGALGVCLIQLYVLEPVGATEDTSSIAFELMIEDLGFRLPPSLAGWARSRGPLALRLNYGVISASILTTAYLS